MHKTTAHIHFLPKEIRAMDINCFTATIRRINYLDLEVYDFSSAKLDKSWRAVNSVLPTNRLYLPKSGIANIEVNEQKIIMRPGTAYLIPAGTPMSCHCDTTMDKLFFHFNLYKPDRYDVLYGANAIYEIPLQTEQLECIYRHAGAGTIFDSFIVKSILYDLLAQFQRKYNLISEHIPIYSRMVMGTITYIHENLSACLCLEDLAKHNFVSRSTLTEVFRKEVGISLGKYIDDQLISSAQRQLSQTNRSIGEISSSLGYSNQCYFSRRFKQMCGMTPQLYRVRTKI